MNVVKNKLYLINKCCNHVKYSINNYNIYYEILITHIYSYSEINIQSRCGNIKHNPGADSQVSQPVADTKVIQKSIFFFKKNVASCTTFAGRPQSRPDKQCMHHSS